MDEGSGLSREAEMTSANVHDGRPEQALIQGNEEAHFADKAHNSPAFRDTLERLGIMDGVLWRASRGHPLGTWQTSVNTWGLGHSLGR